MSVIDQIVSVDIVATSATPALPSLNIPAIYGYHTKYTDRIRTYFDLTDLVADGFTSTDAIYLAALAIVSQDPRPASFKVIRASNAIAQTMHFNVTDTQTGHVDGLVVLAPDGTTHPIQHTVTTGQTAAQIATALAAITVSGLTLAVNGGVNTQVDITVNAAGAVWYPSAVTGGDFFDDTATLTPGTDLDAAVLVDPNFYGIASTVQSDANIQAIAVWVEANERMQWYTTAGTNNINAQTGIFATLKTAAYKRSVGWYSGTPSEFLGLGILSLMLTFDPGSATAFGKTVAGVAADNLSPTQINNAEAQNGNVYVPVAGDNTTLTGIAASGLYADITIGIDALAQDMQIAVFSLMKRSPKVPYTRKGISSIGGEMRGSLQRFVNDGFLSSDTGEEFQVQLPDLAAISQADKQNRILRNAKFTAVATGAIQKAAIQGSLSF
jgi:hypothetical protein